MKALNFPGRHFTSKFSDAPFHGLRDEKTQDAKVGMQKAAVQRRRTGNTGAVPDAEKTKAHRSRNGAPAAGKREERCERYV